MPKKDFEEWFGRGGALVGLIYGLSQTEHWIGAVLGLILGAILGSLVGNLAWQVWLVTLALMWVTFQISIRVLIHDVVHEVRHPTTVSPPSSESVKPSTPPVTRITPRTRMPGGDSPKATSQKRLRLINSCSLDVSVTVWSVRPGEWPVELNEKRGMKTGGILDTYLPLSGGDFRWSARSSHYRRLGGLGRGEGPVALEMLEFDQRGSGEWKEGELDVNYSEGGEISLTCPGAMESAVPFSYPIR